MLDVTEETHPCHAGCGAEITFQRTYLEGKPLGPPLTCDACLAKREAEEEQRRSEARSAAQREVRERRQKMILGLLDEAGASPWEHGRATLANFDPSEAGPEPLEAAKEFVRSVLTAEEYDPVPGLYLAGPTGCGKSHLATAIARALILDPRIDPGTIVFDPADVLVSRIRSLYGGKGDVDAFLRRREKARVWILDDLGREPPHPDVVGHLTMLISQRSNRGTVITGNLLPDQYEGRHPDLGRIGSRLGAAYFRTVKVDGRDRRFDAPTPIVRGTA